jgi:hypothetical protein
MYVTTWVDVEGRRRDGRCQSWAGAGGPLAGDMGECPNKEVGVQESVPNWASRVFERFVSMNEYLAEKQFPSPRALYDTCDQVSFHARAPFIIWGSRRHRVLMLFSIMHHLLYSARIIQRLRGKTFHVWNPEIGVFDSLWIMGFPGVYLGLLF